MVHSRTRREFQWNMGDVKHVRDVHALAVDNYTDSVYNFSISYSTLYCLLFVVYCFLQF